MQPETNLTFLVDQYYQWHFSFRKTKEPTWTPARFSTWTYERWLPQSLQNVDTFSLPRSANAERQMHVAPPAGSSEASFRPATPSLARKGHRRPRRRRAARGREGCRGGCPPLSPAAPTSEPFTLKNLQDYNSEGGAVILPAYLLTYPCDSKLKRKNSLYLTL